ncbi:ankyrin repeat and LEM domain-containing protein 1 isoform X2 [Hemibagrus wyckioides]|uniref:ankyrin repeat and LEM domain-containing protein 1 isoform X2 n=1 Tax=Hemibagrus wyckioides TaxID=337641 RepID=UPI00266BC48C|nr:ankyrin repeat and LEM domain-containing protein 1 isoform X2 [Hemibagrus wyckioides]
MNKNRHNLASLLHAAVNETDVRTVESLLQRGAEPNLVLDEGVAAVHLAAGKESEKGLRCLKVLLQHGADPNLRSGEALTPLHIAALWGCYQNLKLLLKNGGDPSLRDQGGNKAVDLAEQEENSKCASILQEYESHTPQPEYEDLPKFNYSLYSGHPMRDCSMNLSLMSDFGDEPLSSTRYSSFYRKSESNRQWRDRDPHESRLSDVSGLNPCDSDMFNRAEVVGSLPPVLSSTRLSGMDFKKSPDVAQPDRFFTPSRKSVTFREYDEYFPDVKHNDEDTSDSGDSTVDFSLYPDFLHSDRMTPVLQNQGIDVTSPDDVFVFCREGNTTEDFDKTVVGGTAIGEEEEDNKDDVFVDKVDEQKYVTHTAVSSNSGSSQYSSCDSEQYKTTVEALLPSENVSPSEKDRWANGSTGSDSGMKEELHLQPQACNNKITELSLTQSPYVTGRTRSRVSRYSQRHSASSFSTSSLFEQTLPTPTRVRRDVTPSDRPHQRHPYEEDRAEHLDSRMANLSVSSQLPASQADTLIISGSMADTIIIPRGATDDSLERETSSSSSCQQEEDVFTEDKEFLTSDLSSSSTEIHKNTKSQDSSSSSESSSRFSQAFEIPSTGCTPRYSMSRICNRSQIQSLANLSYTPGGRPLITDMDEPVEYLYTDTEEGHELIETHVPPTSNTSLSSSVSEETVIYDWRSLQTAYRSPEKGKENRCPNEVVERMHISETEGLTDRELRRKLVELGEEPGPINRDTRPLYIQKLQTLQMKHVPLKLVQRISAEVEPAATTGYSPELNKVLCSFHLPDCKADEFALCEQFDQPDQNKRWREGVIKSSFNYLLLDPRVTKNLPYRSQAMTPHECFQTFISSIFYVGKGKRSRPYSHLYEALEYFKGDKSSKTAALQLHFVPTGDEKVMSEEDLSTVDFSSLNMRSSARRCSTSCRCGTAATASSRCTASRTSFLWRRTHERPAWWTPSV